MDNSKKNLKRTLEEFENLADEDWMTKSCRRELRNQILQAKQQATNAFVKKPIILTPSSQCRFCNAAEASQGHYQACEKSLEEVPCQFCQEPFVALFLDEHLEQCMVKVNKEFEALMLRETGSIISIKGDPSKLSSQECSICLLEIAPKDEMRFLECGHQYHYACIQLWLKKKHDCPYCRLRVQS